MAYQSKYTGLQIDDILDSVEYKQDQIEDLESIRAGAAKGATALQSYTEKYTGTVTGIKINGTVKSGSGVIDLGTITTVTENTVSGWGFTKNTGTYSKPSGGIPKTDLASAVQTSLGKADTALQSYTEQYKGTITGVSANGTSIATSGVANIPAASTSAYGVTKLSSATNSTSTSLAATASAVKTAYDLANGKQDKLVSGTNIKTINGESILGDGDLSIQSANIVTLDIGSLPTQNSSVAVNFTEDQLQILRLEDTVIKITFNHLGKPHVCTMFHTINGVTHMYSGVAYIVKNSVSYDTNKRYVYGQFGYASNTTNTITFTIGDIILTESDVKTINGQSLIGSGDITISGGSSNANIQAVDTGDVLDDVTVNYATKTYVDGLVGDINSVLESIINGGGITMINFTIDGVKYQAEEGMNWFTWTDSEYNVDGYVPISGHATMGRDLVGTAGSDDYEGYYVKNMSSFVFPYDLIEATSYTTEFNGGMPV